MVQFFKPKIGPSYGAQIAQALGMGFANMAERQQQEKMLQKQDYEQKQAQSQLAKMLFGEEQAQQYEGIPMEEMLKAAQIEKQGQMQQQKNLQSQIEDMNRYKVIEQNFGKKAADLYMSASEGGRTSLLDSWIEDAKRGIDVKSKLNEELGAPAETSDFDKGLTPKERVARQENRYAKNLPLYENSQEKLEGLEAEEDALGILEDLSPQIGTFQRLNVNPLTGELILPFLSSPEAQRFVKTINDFTTKAKATYGSRVTNFELDRFMKRLPTLANSEEGRRQIIGQMQIINKINSAYEQALQKTVSDYGGIRNIDWDIAKSKAKKAIEPTAKELRKEFRSIGSDLDKMVSEQVKKMKENTPEGQVAVQLADGNLGFIPKDQVKNFMKKKGNKLL